MEQSGNRLVNEVVPDDDEYAEEGIVLLVKRAELRVGTYEEVLDRVVAGQGQPFFDAGQVGDLIPRNGPGGQLSCVLRPLIVVLQDRGRLDLDTDGGSVDPKFVAELRRLREEVGAHFSIVVTTWKGGSEEVAESLNLTGSQIREIGLLARDEIVEVVNNCGVYGPVGLVREIVNQAEGRPGLAVTLAYLCLRGGVREVALGDALRRSTADIFTKLVGEEAAQILAAFALGGEAGMHPSSVSSALELPLHKLHSALTRLAAGGVIDRARSVAIRTVGFRAGIEDDPNEEHLVVRPPSLRHALVRDIFFGSGPRLPHGSLVETAPEISEVAHPLAAAALHGAIIPSALLIGVLERAGDAGAWTTYAALGKKEAEKVLGEHPELAPDIASTALRTAPRETLRLLLNLGRV